jgi:hypothetical protein
VARQCCALVCKGELTSGSEGRGIGAGLFLSASVEPDWTNGAAKSVGCFQSDLLRDSQGSGCSCLEWFLM